MTWKLFGDLLLLSHLHFYIPHTIQKNTRNIRQIRFDSRLQCIYKARHTKAAFACPIYVFLSLSLTHAEDLPVIFVLQYHIQQGLRPVYFTLFACCASRCKEQINKSRKSFASCEMLMKYRIYAFSVSFYSFIYIFFFFRVHSMQSVVVAHTHNTRSNGATSNTQNTHCYAFNAISLILILIFLFCVSATSILFWMNDSHIGICYFRNLRYSIVS